MNVSPLDILAAAIHKSDCGCGTPGTVSRGLASVAAKAITDRDVVAHAGQALAADVASRPDSPLHAANMTVAEYERLARVALRSVGGA